MKKVHFYSYLATTKKSLKLLNEQNQTLENFNISKNWHQIHLIYKEKKLQHHSYTQLNNLMIYKLSIKSSTCLYKTHIYTHRVSKKIIHTVIEWEIQRGYLKSNKNQNPESEIHQNQEKLTFLGRIL